MSNESLNITPEQKEVVKLAEEAYKMFYSKFKKLSLTGKNELLNAGFEILVEKLNIDPKSAAIIQQLITMKLSLPELVWWPPSRAILEEQIDFLIELAIYTGEKEEDDDFTDT